MARPCQSLSVVAFVLGLTFMSEGTASPSPPALHTVTLVPSQVGLPPGLSFDAFRDELNRAALQWSYPAVPCAVAVTVAERGAQWTAVQDGVNLVSVRSQTWCHNNRCSHSSTFPLRATGMTTVYPIGATGRDVQEADVELNGVFFELLADAGPSKAQTEGMKGAKRQASLRVALLHELGHVLGLPDACGQGRTRSGRPVAGDCQRSDRQRVMYPFPAATRLSPDDVAALCAIYPRLRQ